MSSHNFVTTIRQLGIDPLAAAVASVSELYKMPQEQLNALKTALISDAFKHHFASNAFYRAACESKGVHPEQIVIFEDLIRIPLIPIAKFKSVSSHELLSKPLHMIEHEMRSTGTSGIPSVSRRCSDTMDVTIVGIYAMYREFLGISSGAGLYICPSTEEIPEMGMIKALNLLAGLLDTHRYMVKQERFVPEDAIAQLNSWDKKFTRHIIGPPFLIYRLLQFLKQTGQRMKLDLASRVITLGGWKRFSGQMISRREFNLLCEEYLGVEPNGVRDIYALVESNMLAIDDQYQVKHASPYVHLTVRDMNDLSKEVPIGEKGVLGILDPLSLSTPGMILTEDVVSLVPGVSPSGRGGQRMEYIMRAPTSLEFGCCAVNLEKKMDEENLTACPIAN
jgi:phenylacetate-coenzyme A ligase PaaK-like adenylate-forming protein